MLRSTLAALAVLGAVAALPAAGQTGAATTVPPAGSVGSTVNGGLPDKAGATTAVGQTKPPGTAADGTRPDLEQKSRSLDRKINTGICTGCK